MKLAFNIIWITEILLIRRQEHPSDKVIPDKFFNIAKNPKYDGYQRGLSSTAYKVFARKTILVVLLKVKLCQTKN